jgi:phosphoadenosine phosphosulfate reductase
MLLSTSRLAALEARLAELSAEEIVRAVTGALGGRVAVLSSMQRAGLALSHLTAQVAAAPVDVVFVDTGLLHPETLATRDRLAARPNLNVRTLAPARTFAEQTREEGLLYVSKEGQERCCDLRKSAPLHAERGRYVAWLSALRREEGGKRGKVPLVSFDAELGALRIHPLAPWTEADLHRYEQANPDVVSNPLHAMGFPTIGCYTCTTPVRPDEDARAGRWRHLADVAYCGINPTDRSAPNGTPLGVEVGDEVGELLQRLDV